MITLAHKLVCTSVSRLRVFCGFGINMLSSLLPDFLQKMTSISSHEDIMKSFCGAPNEAALLCLMERTGYHMLQVFPI